MLIPAVSFTKVSFVLGSWVLVLARCYHVCFITICRFWSGFVWFVLSNTNAAICLLFVDYVSLVLRWLTVFWLLRPELSLHFLTEHNNKSLSKVPGPLASLFASLCWLSFQRWNTTTRQTNKLIKHTSREGGDHIAPAAFQSMAGPFHSRTSHARRHHAT